MTILGSQPALAQTPPVTGVNSVAGAPLNLGAGSKAYMTIIPPDNGATPTPVPYANGGFVGIWTSSPGRILDVDKGSAVGQGIQISGTNDTRLTVGNGMSTVWSWSNGWALPGDFSLIEEGVSGSRIYVKPGGNVGIGTTAPAYLLDVNGQMRAVTYFHTSDARLKADIHPVNNALDKVLALKGVQFNWKSDGRADIGVTAQNVAAVFPDLVSKDGNGMVAVNYDGMIGPMIEAIRELKKENDGLRADLAEIKQSLRAKETPGGSQ